MTPPDKFTASNGRLFKGERNVEYIKKDGRRGLFLVWSGQCVKCNTRYEVTTGLDHEKSAAFGVVHCEEHRLTRAEVAAKWSKAGVDARFRKGEPGNRRRLDDATIAAMRQDYALGTPCSVLSLIYDASENYIRDVVRNRRRK